MQIISYEAENPRAALAHAKKYGKSAQTSYKNDFGDKVRVQFVGVMDLLQLGLEAGPEEVWYEFAKGLLPDERRAKLIPSNKDLVQRASQ